MGATCSRQATPQDDALLAAIRDGDDATVRRHLASFRLSAQPSKFLLWAAQVSALHGASNEGHLGVLRALVEIARPREPASTKEKQAFRGFLNRCNTYGQTPLMLACKNGHTEVVKYLLRVGADPLVPDKVHSRTCLHYAAWNGWADCINVLLSEDCKVQLYNGLVGGAHEAIVKDACGAARMVDIRSESGFTPLHFAVSASNLAAVKALLEKGASLTAEVLQGACYSIWPTGSTPLHIAAAKGSASVVRQILQAHVAHVAHQQRDLRAAQDANGKRPLDVARQLQHTRLEFMLDPAVPLQQAVLPHSHRGSRTHGCPALTVLAGKAVQGDLLGQLDFLAWQLRLRDGASAAMPRSLKRQLMKNAKSPRGLGRSRSHNASKLAAAAAASASAPAATATASPASAPPTPAASSTAVEEAPASEAASLADAASPAPPANAEGLESQLSSDSEDRDTQGALLEAASSAKSAAALLAVPPEVSAFLKVTPPGCGDDAEECSNGDCCVSINEALNLDEEGPETVLLPRGSAKGGSECGVCLDRQTQLLIGTCHHECCYECAMTLVRKTKLSKTSIRCPFCRGVIGSFQLKEKPTQSGALASKRSLAGATSVGA